MSVLLVLALVVVVAARCPGPPPLSLPALLHTLHATQPPTTVLHLDNCSVLSVDNVTFGVLASLHLLNLQHNLIEQLPTDSEQDVFNVTELHVLDLSHNVIHKIFGSPFRTLRALRVLNLSGNAIDVISVDGFRGLDSLQSLDLSRNNLTEVPERVFVPLVSLQHLNLSGNRLVTLSGGWLGSLTRLQQLDVSWNQLQHVAPAALQALPSLARLLLAGNPELGRGQADLLLGSGRRLQAVDAARTGLRHVPHTLTRSVRTLRLANNGIQALRCGDLDSYPLLQLLDLTDNQLSEVEEDALGRLEMLAVLYLTNNELRAIPRSLPDRLEILHLEHNHIEQIVSGDLLGLPRLEVLLLNDNDIAVVQEGAFSQVTALITLDLSRNPISILPGGTLWGPTRLQGLRLAGLTVTPPAEDMAFPVPAPEHLVRLDLGASPGLARQLLADTAALAAFRDLQELNLADTGLTNIRSDLLHYLPQMHEFHLTGNSLNCSGLLWLALWMRRQDQPEYREVTCASPPELYGTLVVDLQDTYIQDMPPTSTSTVSTTTSTDTSTSTTARDAATTEQMQQDDSTAVEETTTIYSTVASSTVSMFNNTAELGESETTQGEEADRWTVTGLQNTVKSSAATAVTAAIVNKEMEELESDRHRSSTSSEREPSTTTTTDQTETVPSVTDGHIDEINPSDNRIATEPSNYTAAAAVVGGVGGARRLAGGGYFVMLVVLVAVLAGAGATLCSVMRRRRLGAHRPHLVYDRHRDVEVSSLASAHELW